jgi:F-type H+-transporting ATPase subunit b
LRFRLKSPVTPLLSFALLLVFGSAVAVAPLRAAAQDQATQPQSPANSAQSSSTQSSADSTKIDPKTHRPIKYQKEVSEDVFTHTKLVESVGKIFGLDIDTSARIFEWLNTLIILFAIVFPLAKVLPKVLRKRRETLKQNLEEARKTTADANSRLSAVEERLSKLDEEIAKIRAQVESEIAQDEARIKSTIGEETARIVAAAEQEISVAAAQAQRGLKAFAADLAIDQAVKQLTLTAENDRALIEEFVAHADNGGKH